MENNKIAVTVVKCVAALVCSVAVAVTSVSIAGKICENENAVADIVASNTADSSSENENNYYSDTDLNSGYAENITDEDASQEATDEVTDTQADNTSDGVSEQETPANKEISVTSGLNSTDKAEILKYYQLVMTKNEKDGLGHNQSMTLTKLDGGSGGVGKFISWFEPVAKKALANNSMSHEGLPGVHDKIKATDFASAKAVNDGRYTTVTINLVEQTDGAYGKTSEGTVGRTIGVLDGVATAIAEINGLNADFEHGELYLHYKNPKVVIKVDNKTGSLVKGACSWGYQVHVDLKRLDVSMMGISLTLNGAMGIVDMVSSY